MTVVGHIPGAAEGANLLMTGDWRDVEKWGTQFVLNCAPEEVAPADEDAMLRYLAGGALPVLSGRGARRRGRRAGDEVGGDQRSHVVAHPQWRRCITEQLDRTSGHSWCAPRPDLRVGCEH